MIFGLFGKRQSQQPSPGEAAYAAIAAAARRPAFYRDLGAPDTLPGRFEMLVLHAALCTRRLGRDPDPRAKEFSQGVFDAMIAALDSNLREIGVGDVTVPKRMKAMARSFFDGAKVYDAALDAGDRDALAEAIARIVYAGEPADAEGPRAIAAWAFEADAALRGQTLAELEAAGPAYPQVSAHLDARETTA